MSQNGSRQGYRLSYHFSPAENWTNDPCGLIYHKGLYHVYFQYNPHGDLWGNMSWGHATSTDLLSWKEHKIALAVTDDVMAFTGSCIYDAENVSGLGTADSPPMLAYFTGFRENDGKIQDQRMAFSTDDGYTWELYVKNPLIDIGSREFRDPHVIRCPEGNKWIMSIAMAEEKKIAFYESTDLINWELTGNFGPEGCCSGCWECPNLIPLTAADGTRKYCLLVSVGFGNEECFPPGVQYFIGDYDGGNFTNSYPSDEILWMDRGHDFYAPQIFSNPPNGRTMVLSWFLSWIYGDKTPTSPQRGAMTLPRDISLINTPQGFRLNQRPSPELQSLRGQMWQYPALAPEQINKRLTADRVCGRQLEIIVKIRNVESGSELEIKVLKHATNFTSISYANSTITIDRSNSGEVDFHDKFHYQMSANIDVGEARETRVHMFIDSSGVEVFGDGCTPPISARVFPPPTADAVEISGRMCLVELTIYELTLPPREQ